MALSSFNVGSFGTFTSIGGSAGVPPWVKPQSRLSLRSVDSKVLKEKFIAEQHLIEFGMTSDASGHTATLTCDGAIISPSGPYANRSDAEAALAEMIRLQGSIAEAVL